MTTTSSALLSSSDWRTSFRSASEALLRSGSVRVWSGMVFPFVLVRLRTHGADSRGRMAVQPARDKAPGRRLASGELPGLGGLQPETLEGARRRRGQRCIAPARARESGDGNRAEQVAPARPVDELGQDVGAHQPHELRLRIDPLQRLHRVERVARAQQQLGRVDADARMVGDLAGTGHARRQRLHAVAALQRVLRRDQPPHFVEAEALQRLQADVPMAGMGRVERAAQQADAPRRGARHARHRMDRAHGRSVPLPRTMFL